MADINNPHDKFFKETFSQLEVAQDFCFHYLLPKIPNLIPSTLTQAKDSFINPQLQEQFTDLLYSARLTSGEVIWLLFEHKSSLELHTALQLLGYKHQIWNHELKAIGNDTLHPILSSVIYHGEKQWNVPQDFQSLMPTIEGLEDNLLQFRYFLFDLTQYEDEQIVGNFMLRTTFMLFKSIRSDRLGKTLDKIKAMIREQGKGINRYKQFLQTVLERFRIG